MQSVMIHETPGEITANDLAQKLGKGVDGIRIKYSALFAEGHPLFVAKFDRHAPLSPAQIEVLSPSKNRNKKASVPDFDVTKGRSKEAAPILLEAKKTYIQSGLLLSVCALCATASVSNMLDISMQIKGVYWAACIITAIFTLSPFAVFYAGVKAWVSWLVSGICIGYEVFCNSVGIYRGLSGLGRGLPYEVWEPGGFIDSVSRVTTIGFKPCALGISFTMAGIIAGLFLVCLNELKK